MVKFDGGNNDDKEIREVREEGDTEDYQRGKEDRTDKDKRVIFICEEEERPLFMCPPILFYIIRRA